MDKPAPAGLAARVCAQMDRRLMKVEAAPVALALSGGGDSMALLSLAADWCRRSGRGLLALTVDHGLATDSARWTAQAAEAASWVGADWLGLLWAEPKPGPGLSARARRSRHALLAEAAREAGARVILFAHTADDIAEADWMRARGATLGRLRDWAPSPVWPEGRGLMLFRPLLDERRETLRAHLQAKGMEWIEDPANADPLFGRARARAALDGQAEPREALCPPLADDWSADAAGVVHLGREASAATLGMALTAAGGGEAPPRGGAVARLVADLRQGATVQATLAGARLATDGDHIQIAREAGDRRGRFPPMLALTPGRKTVWDGRFLVRADRPGWSIGPAAGLRARLDGPDRLRINALPPHARAAHPVLFGDAPMAPVLAGEGVEVRSLVAERLRLALGGTTDERDLVTHAMA